MNSISTRYPFVTSFLTRRFFRVFSILILVIISGCSTYKNVTAYFNTYYNASKLFSDAERDIDQTPQKDRDTNYFAAYNVSKTTEDNLDKVIEKCSKILQNYPQSSWTENAIMMIGKSYFYKGKNQSAVREFTELLDNFPASGSRFEAKLWSAKALYLMKKEDKVLPLIKDLLDEARQEGKNDILLEDLLLQGQIYFEHDEYDQASATYVLAVAVSGDDNLRAIAQSRLATCYELLGDNKQAAMAYGKVAHFHPNFSLEFQARLKEGMMYSMSGDHQHALDLFDDLRHEPLKTDQHSLVDLETANAYRRLGDTARAFGWYRYIDTTYVHSDAAAKSYYECGKLYEKGMRDYKSALKYYDKARSENTTSDIIPIALQKYTVFSNYFVCYKNYIYYDSLFVKALHQDSIAQAKKDSLALYGSLLTQDIHSDTTTDKNRFISGLNDSLKTIQNLAVAKIGSDSSLRKIDSSKLRPSQALSDSTRSALKPPDVSIGQRQPPADDEDDREHLESHHGRNGKGANDPRLARAEAGAMNLKNLHDVPLGKKDSVGNQQKLAGAIPPSALSKDTLRFLTAQSQFELAGLFFLQLNIPDSALFWYQHVVDEFPNSPFVVKSLYVMSQIYLTLPDSAKTDSMYAIILNRFGKSAYAREVKKLQGIDVSITEQDSLEQKYQNAEKNLQDGKVRDALANYREIADGDSTSPFTPKAMYTVGWIYESLLFKNDSATSWYKRLMKKFPNSLYASAVQPKVAVKENPKSLSQYIKIKEIPLMRSVGNTKADSTAILKEAKGVDEENTDDDEELKQGRHGSRDDDDEDTDTNDDDTTNTDDDNN